MVAFRNTDVPEPKEAKDDSMADSSSSFLDLSITHFHPFYLTAQHSIPKAKLEPTHLSAPLHIPVKATAHMYMSYSWDEPRSD